MSCNIETWKTKRLENLRIPLKAFFTHSRNDWHPKVRVANPVFAPNKVTLACGCEQEISGELVDGILIVASIDMSGEGSGTFFDWIFEPALKVSAGSLVATLIWETGDVERFTVEDGAIDREEINL